MPKVANTRFPECRRLDCFANIPINARESAGLCTILTECIKENCPFYKTKKEFKEGVRHGDHEKEIHD